MVNFHDPNVIQSDAVAVVHFSLALVGIFLWEFVTTISFEWDYVAAKRKFKWPLLLYSTCRICALGSTICFLIGVDVTREIDCQQWATWDLIFVFISFTCASVLITIRVIAIWSHSHLVMAVTIGICIINMGFLLYGVAMFRSDWSNALRTCIQENTPEMRYNILMTTVTDVAQLIIMLIGLLRIRREKRGLYRYLYIQGLIWLVAATLAETPSAVFIILNLNDPWNMMFQQFTFLTMVICATRMYRSLILYDMDLHKYSDGPDNIGSLRFGASPRKGTVTVTGTGNGSTAATTDRFDPTVPTFVRTSNLEISLAEKATPAGDEEAQPHKVLSLLVHEDSYR